MGLFRRIRDNRRLDDVEDELSKLKRAFAALELDWMNCQDKLKSMMQRIAKRAEVAEKLQAQADEDEGEVAESSNGQAQPGRLMTARQRQMQQTILQRRAGLMR